MRNTFVEDCYKKSLNFPNYNGVLKKYNSRIFYFPLFIIGLWVKSIKHNAKFSFRILICSTYISCINKKKTEKYSSDSWKDTSHVHTHKAAPIITIPCIFDVCHNPPPSSLLFFHCHAFHFIRAFYVFFYVIMIRSSSCFCFDRLSHLEMGDGMVS